MMEIFGKEENIKNKLINEKTIKGLMSGKSYEDENFPVSSFIIKRNIRKITRIFYYFARMADDIADNKNLKSKLKVKILLYFNDLINKNKYSDNKILNNLIQQFESFPFGKKYSKNLLKAFLLDSSEKKYKTWNDLIFYCKYSANPVGRFVIDLVYYQENKGMKVDPKIYDASDKLCTSLQIINHLQDCKEDFKKLKRVYIPDTFFKKYSVSKKNLELGNSNQQFRMLVDEIVLKIEVFLSQSKNGLNLIRSWRLKKETLIILNIAKRLCYLLKREDPLKKKIKLSRIDLLFCFIKGIIYD